MRHHGEVDNIIKVDVYVTFMLNLLCTQLTELVLENRDV